MKTQIVNLSVAAIWWVMGLYAKVLGFVPRHEQIVGEILGADYAPSLTLLIGLGEVAIGCWFLWDYKRKWNVALQIGLIVLMNILEFWLVPHLLLWGQFNLLFALLFSAFLYYFYLKK